MRAKWAGPVYADKTPNDVPDVLRLRREGEKNPKYCSHNDIETRQYPRFYKGKRIENGMYYRCFDCGLASSRYEWLERDGKSDR